MCTCILAHKDWTLYVDQYHGPVVWSMMQYKCTDKMHTNKYMYPYVSYIMAYPRHDAITRMVAMESLSPIYRGGRGHLIFTPKY